MNIYIGNLSYRASEEDLQATFGEFGEVSRATIARDSFTGRSKGFGFVEMVDEKAGQSAIEALNGTDMQGRQVLVQPAKPRLDERTNSAEARRPRTTH